MVGTIIGEGLATLHELRTIYTFEDAFDMWEVSATRHFNEWLSVRGK